MLVSKLQIDGRKELLMQRGFLLTQNRGKLGRVSRQIRAIILSSSGGIINLVLATMFFVLFVVL